MNELADLYIKARFGKEAVAGLRKTAGLDDKELENFLFDNYRQGEPTLDDPKYVEALRKAVLAFQREMDPTYPEERLDADVKDEHEWVVREHPGAREGWDSAAALIDKLGLREKAAGAPAKPYWSSDQLGAEAKLKIIRDALQNSERIEIKKRKEALVAAKYQRYLASKKPGALEMGGDAIKSFVPGMSGEAVLPWWLHGTAGVAGGLGGDALQARFSDRFNVNSLRDELDWAGLRDKAKALKADPGAAAKTLKKLLTDSSPKADLKKLLTVKKLSGKARKMVKKLLASDVDDKLIAKLLDRPEIASAMAKVVGPKISPWAKYPIVGRFSEGSKNLRVARNALDSHLASQGGKGMLSRVGRLFGRRGGAIAGTIAGLGIPALFSHAKTKRLRSWGGRRGLKAMSTIGPLLRAAKAHKRWRDAQRASLQDYTGREQAAKAGPWSNTHSWQPSFPSDPTSPMSWQPLPTAPTGGPEVVPFEKFRAHQKNIPLDIEEMLSRKAP